MTNHPRVFLPQLPTRLDPETGRVIPAFDLSPAREWGALVTLSDLVGNPISFIDDHRERMLSVMEAEGLDSADYLLCAGNPLLIALAAALVADRTGGLRLLQWSRGQGRYEVAECRLWLVQGEAGVEPQRPGVAAAGDPA